MNLKFPEGLCAACRWIRASLKKNFRYSMGAPWVGAQGASEAAVFSILPELATQRDGPRRPGE